MLKEVVKFESMEMVLGVENGNAGTHANGTVCEVDASSSFKTTFKPRAKSTFKRLFSFTNKIKASVWDLTSTKFVSGEEIILVFLVQALIYNAVAFFIILQVSLGKYFAGLPFK